MLVSGADPGIFERGGPEAIIYKILERGGPKSLKMAFECSFQSFSCKSFANIPQKGGAQAPWAPLLNPPLGFGKAVITELIASRSTTSQHLLSCC